MQQKFESYSLVARSSHFSGCFWFFAPKFWEVAEVYKLFFSSKRNATSVVLTMSGGGDTQTLLDGKKKLHTQVVGMQKLSDFP